MDYLTCLPVGIKAGTNQWPLECVIYVTRTKCGQMSLQIVGPSRAATVCVKSVQRKCYHVASHVLSAGLTMYGNLVNAKVNLGSTEPWLMSNDSSKFRTLSLKPNLMNELFVFPLQFMRISQVFCHTDVHWWLEYSSFILPSVCVSQELVSPPLLPCATQWVDLGCQCAHICCVIWNSIMEIVVRVPAGALGCSGFGRVSLACFLKIMPLISETARVLYSGSTLADGSGNFKAK